ncbi:hypothetical protein CY35_14G076900 [Sphagnum magellanicum]|nr:hypothetical protein CY35_14G076900 [Sphagnum magellanicum]
MCAGTNPARNAEMLVSGEDGDGFLQQAECTPGDQKGQKSLMSLQMASINRYIGEAVQANMTSVSRVIGLHYIRI